MGMQKGFRGAESKRLGVTLFERMESRQMLSAFTTPLPATGAFELSALLGNGLVVAEPSVTVLSNGNLVAVWSEPNANGENVYMRMFNTQGEMLGDATKLNESYRQDNELPSVAALSDGGFVVVWNWKDEETRFFIAGDRFDAQGQPRILGNFSLYWSGSVYRPEVTGLANGGFVVGWRQGNTYQGQVYDAQGQLAGDRVVIVETMSDGYVSISGSGDGFVATWLADGVVARQFDAAGNALGDVIQVDADDAQRQEAQAQVTTLADGGFVVMWHEWFNKEGDVYARQYGPDGAPLGPGFAVHEASSKIEEVQTLCALADGGYVLFWSVDQWTNNGEARGQRYDALGAKVGETFVVGEEPGYFWSMSAHATDDSGFAVVWNTGTRSFENTDRRFRGQVFSVDSNQQPSFTAGNAPAVIVTPWKQTIAGWATFDPGAPEEANQKPTYVVSNVSRPELFSVLPEIDANGQLTYTPRGWEAGVSTFTVTVKDSGGTANGGIDTSAPQTFTITIRPVNTTPSFTASNPAAANEDSGPQVVPGWAAFNPGGPEEAYQTATYTVSNVSKPALFSELPTVDADGTLRYTPAPDAFGTSTFKIRVQDSGGTAQGGFDTGRYETFTITVNAVNDTPTLSVPNVVVNEGAGQVTLKKWASVILGPGNESGQTAVLRVISVSNPALFDYQPDGGRYGASDELIFSVAYNAFGVSTVQMVAVDSGWTANGGNDTSEIVTFTITVNPVNDAPEFYPANLGELYEDGGERTYSDLGRFVPGPVNESDQVATFRVVSVDKPEMFSVLPNIGVDGKLRFTTAPDANGTVMIGVECKDSGGTEFGGVDKVVRYFSFWVRPVNDSPSFVAVDPPAVLEDAGAQSVPGWAVFVPGPANESAEVNRGYTVTGNSNPGLFSVAPKVTLDGTLTYTPVPGAFGTAVIKVIVQDSGSYTAESKSLEQTYTITVTPVNDLPMIGKLETGGSWHAAGEVVRLTASGVMDVDSKVSKVAFYRDTDDDGIAQAGELIGLGALVEGRWVFDMPTTGLPFEKVNILAVATDAEGGVSATVSASFDFYRMVAPTGKNNFVQYTDAHGNTVKATLTGGGTVKAFFETQGNADAAKVFVEGSTVKSSLVIAVTKGKGSETDQTSVGSIEVAGGLASLTGAKVNLTHSLQADGLVKAVTLNDVAGDGQRMIHVGGAASDKVALTFGKMVDVSIDSSAGISSLKALDWQDTNEVGDYLSAASLGTLTMTGRAENKTTKVSKLSGDLEADITLTYAAVGVKTPPTVSSIMVSGGAMGDWDFGAHKVNAITIKGDLERGMWASDGGFGSVTISGRVNLLSITTVKDIASFKGGQVAGAQFKVDGAIGSLSVIDYVGGAIHAGKIGALSTLGRAGTKTVSAVAGDFSADMDVAGVSTVANAKSVGSINIKGSVTGGEEDLVEWNVAGGVGPITIGGSVTRLIFYTTTKGYLDGNVGHLGALTVGGVVRETNIEPNGKVGVVTIGSADHFVLMAAGDIGATTVKGQAESFGLHATRNLGAVTAVSWSRGVIFGDKIASINIKGQAATKTTPAIAGDFWGSEIYAVGEGLTPNTLVLGSLTIAGTLDNTWCFVTGKAGAVTLGAIRDSKFLVGVEYGIALPTASGQFSQPGAVLQSFTVTGKAVSNASTVPSFVNSRVAAGVLLNVSVKLVDVGEDEVNGFVAASRIGTYSRQTGPKAINVLRVANKTTPDLWDSAGGYGLRIVP